MRLLLKRGEFLADDPNGHYVTNKIRIPAGGITFMRMKVIICDDEKAFCSSIRQQIECWATGRGHEKEVFVSEFHSSEDLLASLEAGEECQILFLDIEIPAEMSGMEAAKEIYSHNPYLPIVFVTNYSNYACEGYEVNALRYLVKPVTQSAIDQCLDIAWKKAELTLDKSIIVRDGNSVIALPLVDFVCAESARHNLIISTTENVQYSERKKLSQFLQETPSSLILQCHRSYAVNMMHVRKLTSGWATMTNGMIIPISSRYEDLFYDQFMQYHQGKGLIHS